LEGSSCERVCLWWLRRVLIEEAVAVVAVAAGYCYGLIFNDAAVAGSEGETTLEVRSRIEEIIDVVDALPIYAPFAAKIASMSLLKNKTLRKQTG